MSTDGGFHWSTPEKISGSSSKLCFFGNAFDPKASAHDCNFDQGSDPITLANGDLLVPFNNGNTPATDPNAQQLAVRCSPEGQLRGGYRTLQLRVTDQRRRRRRHRGAAMRLRPRPGGVRPRDRSSAPTTSPAARTAGRRARSTSPGRTIATASTTSSCRVARRREHLVTVPDSQSGRGIDHYFPAVDNGETGRGDRVGVSYYRSDRVPGENTTPEDGFVPGRDPGVGAKHSDYVLAGGRMKTPFDFSGTRQRSPPDGIQTGFNGDYTGSSSAGTRPTRSGPTPATSLRPRSTGSATTRTSSPPPAPCPPGKRPPPPKPHCTPDSHPTTTATRNGPSPPVAPTSRSPHRRNSTNAASGASPADITEPVAAQRPGSRQGSVPALPLGDELTSRFQGNSGMRRVWSWERCSDLR